MPKFKVRFTRDHYIVVNGKEVGLLYKAAWVWHISFNVPLSRLFEGRKDVAETLPEAKEMVRSFFAELANA